MTPGDTARYVQTQSEGPFADPAQGAGTRGAELGTHRWSHIVSPAGIEPGTFRPAGERGRSTTLTTGPPLPQDTQSWSWSRIVLSRLQHYGNVTSCLFKLIRATKALDERVEEKEKSTRERDEHKGKGRVQENGSNTGEGEE